MSRANYPYPDARDIRDELEADDLVSQQLTNCQKLMALCDAFLLELDKMDWPCGQPCSHYHIQEMRDALREMRPDQTIEQMTERALEMVEEPV